MKRYYILLSVIVLSLMLNSSLHATGKGSFDKPNFNFPKTVIQNAETKLQQALKNGNGEETVSAIIQSSLAKSMISSDSLPNILTNIENIIINEKNENIKSILYLLEAKIINSYYNDNRYMLNRRNINNTSTENINEIFEWNIQQFKLKTSSLLDSALKVETLIKTPVTTYPKLIIINDISIDTYPSLYDFVAYQAIDIYKSIGAKYYWNPFVRYQPTFDEELCNKVVDIYNSIISSHRTEAPRIMAMLNRMEFTEDDSIEQLDSLYQLHKHSAEAAPIVIKIAKKETNKTTAYNLLNSFLKEFPNNRYSNIIKEGLLFYELPKAQLTFKDYYSSKDSITIICEAENLTNFTVNLYRINENITNKYDFSDEQPYYSQTFELSKKLPFCDTLNITLPPFPYGQYTAIVNAIDNNDKHFEQTRTYHSSFVVSDITSFSILDHKTGLFRIFAAHAIDGTPYNNVTISSTTNGKYPKEFYKVTNYKGFVNITDNSFNLYHFSKGKDNSYSTNYNIKNSRYFSEAEHYTYRANIFTNLAIYRPGETINSSAVCFRTKPNKKELLINNKIEISLVDASYETIETQRLTTDNHGRIAYDFTIPTNRLNGTYHIYVKDLATHNTLATKNIIVSEYKSPTFYIEFIDIKNIYNKNDKEITISGVAKTYSGIPVSNAPVNCSISIESLASFDIDTNTDENGCFSITIDTNKLNIKKKLSFYYLEITAQITDLSGESQSCKTHLSIGNPITIRWNDYYNNQLNINASEKCVLPITINSAEDSTSCTLMLKSIKDKTETTYRFNTSNPSFYFSNLESGEYALSAWVNDDSTVRIDPKPVVIYRDTDQTCPVNVPLWTPHSKVECIPGKTFSILLGSSIANNNIYYTINYKDKILKEGWKCLPKGISTLKHSMPNKANADVRVQLCCIKNHKLYSYEIIITPKHEDIISTLKIESFRDKVTAGDTEKWNIHFSENGNPVTNGAIIASLTDKAINQLHNNNWDFNIDITPYYTIWSMGYPQGNYYTNSRNSFNWRISAYDSIIKINQFLKISVPQFFFYNQEFFSSRIRYKSGLMLDNKNYSKNIMFKSQFGEPTKVYTSDERIPLASDNISSNPNIEIRTSHIKTVFWTPLLVTDENGNASIEFIVPNYNTTWMFQAVGYDKDLNTATLLKEIVSNKPIMVKSNMPRFLRQGDRATLMASIQNATDSTQHCTAYVELFNPINNEIYITKDFNYAIDAEGTQITSIEFTVPDTISLIAFRVKATNGTHSDGEQVLVPILENISPVIASKPFYIEQGEENKDITLPDFPKNANTTLEYCDNPMWYIASSLPVINSDDNTTATQIAHSFFAHTVAEKVAKSYPQILNAIKYWKEHPQDSALVSMLAKNTDLKIGNLLASPFLQDSKEQTLRLSQLAKLFDETSNKTTIVKLTEQLRELQQEDGGFSWYKGNRAKSSLSTTLYVLEIIGRAKSLGVELDINLKNIIDLAVKYLDENLMTKIKKQKEISYSGYLNFAYIRSLFLNIPLSYTEQHFYRRFCESLSTEWEGMAIDNKAFAAITLANFGYIDKAKPILKSIDQYSIYIPEQGRFWDNLNDGWSFYANKVAITSLVLQAYQRVTPNSPHINQIKQWLLIEKQTQDWGNSSMAAEAVYAYLTTGDTKLETSALPNISINGNALTFNSIDKILGYCKISLNIDKTKKNILSINRTASSPAWGAIYSKYYAPMKDIKAASCSALSIKKVISNISSQSDTFKVGDKVRVTLIITNSRDLEFVTLTDDRPACIEPSDQISGYRVQDLLGYYMEVKDSATNLFFYSLPKGTHVITYDAYVTNPGKFNCGIATIQCQYAPQIVAHSAGSNFNVK